MAKSYLRVVRAVGGLVVKRLRLLARFAKALAVEGMPVRVVYEAIEDGVGNVSCATAGGNWFVTSVEPRP